MFYLQLGIVLLGILLLKYRGQIRLGRYELSGPVASLVGLILVGQLFVAFLAWGILGVQDGIAMVRGKAGVTTVEEAARAYWWVNPAVTGGALLLAGIVTAAGLRRRDDPLRDGSVRSTVAEATTRKASAATETGPGELAGFDPPPEVVELGRPSRVFREGSLLATAIDRASPWLRPLAGAPGGAGRPIGLGLAAFGAFVLLVAATAPLKVSVEARAGIGVGGAIGLGLGLLLTFGTFGGGKRGASFAYALYPEALAHVQDGTWTVIRWDEVAEFYGRHLENAVATLVTQGGHKIQLRPDVTDPVAFYREIERHVYGSLVPRTLDAINAGQVVQIGPFSLSIYELKYKNKAMSWDDIEKVEIISNPGAGGPSDPAKGLNNVRLRIAKRGEPWMAWWCVEPFLTLPNRGVLLKLLHHFRPARSEMAVTGAVGLFMPQSY